MRAGEMIAPRVYPAPRQERAVLIVGRKQCFPVISQFFDVSVGDDDLPVVRHSVCGRQLVSSRPAATV